MIWTKSLLDQQEISYTANRNFDHQQLLYASISFSPWFGKYRGTGAGNDPSATAFPLSSVS